MQYDCKNPGEFDGTQRGARRTQLLGIEAGFVLQHVRGEAGRPQRREGEADGAQLQLGF
jgi:hypothetical protein